MLPLNQMPASTVVELLAQFQAAGIRVWIDGGWAVDALLGEQTRLHSDLDIVVRKHDVEKMRHVVQQLGYQDRTDENTRSWNFIMADAARHEIDFHVIEVDGQGDGMYGPPELNLTYPADSLVGQGVISGFRVACISPEWLVRFHTGYEFDEQDVQDVFALHNRFDVPLPPEYHAYFDYGRRTK